MHRYSNAYAVSGAHSAIGATIKAMGVLTAVLIAIVGVFGGSKAGGPVFVASALVAAVVAGVPIYVLGVLVSAQGEILKATLDVAVHTSPFLSNEHKRAALSLEGEPDPGPREQGATAGTADNETLMGELGITFDGERYHYKNYKYDKLQDAVNYARQQGA